MDPAIIGRPGLGLTQNTVCLGMWRLSRSIGLECPARRVPALIAACFEGINLLGCSLYLAEWHPLARPALLQPALDVTGLKAASACNFNENLIILVTSN